MTKLVEQIETSLAREAAFRYVADFSRQAEWDPNTVSSRRIDDGELGVGARFALEVKMGPRLATMEYRITEWQAPSRVVLIGEGSSVWTEDSIMFTETASGTSIEYVFDIRLAGALGLIQPLLRRAFTSIGRGAAAGMKRELDRLAAASGDAAAGVSTPSAA